MNKNILLIILVIVIILIGVLVVRFLLGGPEDTWICDNGQWVKHGAPAGPAPTTSCGDNQQSVKVNTLSEPEARVIAEQTCIKGGESLALGYYNANSKTWWFDANLNATQPGCNPACVVSEETRQVEINWRCTGLVIPPGAAEAIQQLFVQKYPKYAENLTVSVDQETENYARGSVIFAIGMPGGIFLAVKEDTAWKIVFDGNGAIPCTLSEYGFPSEMLADCAVR